MDGFSATHPQFQGRFVRHAGAQPLGSRGAEERVDIGSRPYGQSVWSGLPGAVVSASPGAIGGFGANHHLRQSLVFLNVPAMPQPEAYIGGADKLFAADGSLSSD